MDIVIGILLAMRNKKIVMSRGRRPGLFIFITLLLWFGMEIIGAVIGSLLGWSLYDMTTMLYLLLLAYGMAGIGGLIAYLVAKSCRPGDYYPAPPYMNMPPYPGMPPYGMPPAMPPYGIPYAPPAGAPAIQAEILDAPATIDIVRDASIKGDLTSWTFILNGETVGKLGNGASRSVITKQKQNTLRAVSEDGDEYMPLMFDIRSGGRAEIHFKADRFVPEACTGISPMSRPPMPQPASAAPAPEILRPKPLASPATLVIVRESGAAGPMMTWVFYINGISLGTIADGQTVTAQTGLQRNTLRAFDANGNEAPPLLFSVQSGGHAEIHFQSGRFLPEKSTGIFPLSAPMTPPAPAAQLTPEAGATCPKCGAPVRWEDQYCNRCGAKQHGSEEY